MLKFYCLQDVLTLIINVTGENEDSPLEFYLEKGNGETKLLNIKEIVSDEAGTVGIYLKEVK